MSRDDRTELALLWRECAQISRRAIFSTNDTLRPIYDADGPIVAQVDTPAVGTVGPNYGESRVCFVSVNPAGGKSTSTSNGADDRLYDAFARVRDAEGRDAVIEAFESMVSQFAICVPRWTIARQYIDPILGALKLRFEDVSYLYLVPFRTRGDAGSKMPEQFTRIAYETHLSHQLSATRPTLLIAVDRPSEAYCRLWASSAPERPEVFYYTRKRDAHAERRALLAQLARYAR